MRRWLLSLSLLTPLLSGCTFVSTPRDAAQWSTTVHGVTVTWRWVTPGALARRGDTPYAGYTLTAPFAWGCVVDIDPALSRHDLVRVAAHEYGHCAAGLYLQLGASSLEGLSAYHRQLWEQWPERYAEAYLAACGPWAGTTSPRPPAPRPLTPAPSPPETSPGHPERSAGFSQSDPSCSLRGRLSGGNPHECPCPPWAYAPTS